MTIEEKNSKKQDNNSSFGEQSSESQYPTKDIPLPHDNDVLCGRGGFSNHHIGNCHWRMLVSNNKRLYITLPKRQKMLLSESIVAAVRMQNPTGRFLQKNNETGLWSDIGQQKAVDKTSQALREGAPDLRKEMLKKRQLVPPGGRGQFNHMASDSWGYGTYTGVTNNFTFNKPSNKTHENMPARAAMPPVELDGAPKTMTSLKRSSSSSSKTSKKSESDLIECDEENDSISEDNSDSTSSTSTESCKIADLKTLPGNTAKMTLTSSLMSSSEENHNSGVTFQVPDSGVHKEHKAEAQANITKTVPEAAVHKSPLLSKLLKKHCETKISIPKIGPMVCDANDSSSQADLLKKHCETKISIPKIGPMVCDANNSSSQADLLKKRCETKISIPKIGPMVCDADNSSSQADLLKKHCKTKTSIPKIDPMVCDANNSSSQADKTNLTGTSAITPRTQTNESYITEAVTSMAARKKLEKKISTPPQKNLNTDVTFQVPGNVSKDHHSVSEASTSSPSPQKNTKLKRSEATSIPKSVLHCSDDKECTPTETKRPKKLKNDPQLSSLAMDERSSSSGDGSARRFIANSNNATFKMPPPPTVLNRNMSDSICSLSKIRDSYAQQTSQQSSFADESSFSSDSTRKLTSHNDNTSKMPPPTALCKHKSDSIFNEKIKAMTAYSRFSSDSNTAAHNIHDFKPKHLVTSNSNITPFSHHPSHADEQLMTNNAKRFVRLSSTSTSNLKSNGRALSHKETLNSSKSSYAKHQCRADEVSSTDTCHTLRSKNAACMYTDEEKSQTSAHTSNTNGTFSIKHFLEASPRSESSGMRQSSFNQNNTTTSPDSMKWGSFNVKNFLEPSPFSESSSFQNSNTNQPNIPLPALHHNQHMNTLKTSLIDDSDDEEDCKMDYTFEKFRNPPNMTTFVRNTSTQMSDIALDDLSVASNLISLSRNTSRDLFANEKAGGEKLVFETTLSREPSLLRQTSLLRETSLHRGQSLVLSEMSGMSGEKSECISFCSLERGNSISFPVIHNFSDGPNTDLSRALQNELLKRGIRFEN